MTVTTQTYTLQDILNLANPADIADALRETSIGNMLAPVKVVVTGLAATTVVDITAAATKAAAVITGITLESGQNLPAMLSVNTLRVTAGAAAAAPRGVVDAGGTASATYAKISDDGTSLTFEGTVTGFVLEYSPRSATALTSNWSNQG